VGIRVTDALRKKILIALLAAGVSGPSAYYATTKTVDAEGFVTQLHLDPVGLPTLCVGHLAMKGEKVKQNYTEEECIAIFVSDWVKHERLLNEKVKVPYRSEWMKGSLTDFTFNKGIGNLASSTLLKDLNAKRYDRACDRLSDWVYGKVNGKKVKLRGLEIRASVQWKACMGEVPATYVSDMVRWGAKDAL